MMSGWGDRESSGLCLSGFEYSNHTFSLPCLITEPRFGWNVSADWKGGERDGKMQFQSSLPMLEGSTDGCQLWSVFPIFLCFFFLQAFYARILLNQFGKLFWDILQFCFFLMKYPIFSVTLPTLKAIFGRTNSQTAPSPALRHHCCLDITVSIVDYLLKFHQTGWVTRDSH